MKNTHVTISLILALILGIFIGTSFKGCNSTDPCTVIADTVTITKTRIDTVTFEKTATNTRVGL
jgi:hypothetical protein